MVEYRALGDEHREVYWNYTGYAFSPDSGQEPYDPDEHEPERMAMGDRRGVFADGAAPDDPPRCVCAHHWFDALVRGERHPAPGLSAVASPPEHRRQGYVRQLLLSALEEYRSRNDRFSLLWPFRYHFYRQYGWETCAEHRMYSCEPSALSFARAAYGDSGSYRQLSADDYGVIEPVYESYAGRYALSVGRTATWWRHRIFSGWDADPYVYVWERGGEARGYLSYTIDGEWGERTMRIRDLAFVDHEALLALCAFCSNHDSQADEVRFALPRDVNVLDLADEPEDIECEHKTGAMARIVDVESTLDAIRYPDTDGRVTMSIEDPLAEWNERSVRLTVEGGVATCEPVSTGGHADLTLDIGLLTQLVVGYRSASELAWHGRLDAPAEIVDTLDRLYPPTETYLGTGF